MRTKLLLAAALLASAPMPAHATGPYDDYSCTQTLTGFQYALAAHQGGSTAEYPLTYNAVYFAHAANYHAEMGRATNVPEYFTYAYIYSVYAANYAQYSFDLTGNLNSLRARIFLDDASLQSIGAFDDHNRRRRGGGGGQTELRAEGTLIQNVPGTSVTIRQSNGTTVTVTVTNTTEFERNDIHVAQSALRVGDFAQARYNSSRVATKVESRGP